MSGRGVGDHPDPAIRGGGCDLENSFLQPFGPQCALKIRWSLSPSLNLPLTMNGIRDFLY